MAKASRTIVFTEQFFYPEGWGGAQLPRDITTYLAKSGYAVEVICGVDQYAPSEDADVEDPVQAGVRIRRIPRLLGGDIHRWKFLRQAWFCLAAIPLLLFRRAPRLFVTQTNPPLIVPLVALAAALRRRPFVIIAQDLYPEVVIAHGMMRAGSAAALVLRRVFNWAYRHAARVVSLGPVMSQRLVSKGVAVERIVEISNWATGGEETVVRGADNRLRTQWGLERCFVVLYSGNLGIAHDVETPILALREVLRDAPATRLVFVGSGSRLAEAQRIAADAGVSHAVTFRPLVPFELLPHSLGLADVALVTLRVGFEGLVVPSKLLGYMARGIPTLYVGPPSDAQQLLDSSGGGLCVANGQVSELAHALRRLASEHQALEQMGCAARKFYRERLTRATGLEGYRLLVEGTGG